jgi:outer membrane receptor protein involved in Fe transport
VLSYTSGQGNQSRIRLAREVSQLDLKDFISATVFEDDDLALGNPNIRPQTTLVTEVSQEQRFGKDKVIKVTGFHHWITDVLDLLPLSASYEAPGNIGDGRRWGVELESTFPLDPLGLPGAKIDFRALWEDSQVTDPVTGLKRRLSGDGGGSGYRTLTTLNTNIGYHLRADFRQDFEAARVAWGWTVADRGQRPLYKVNELDVHSEGAAANVFIETTRWFGIKIRLEAENMLNFQRHRERTIFVGERDLTPVESIIVRDRQHDISRFALFLNGSF